MALTIDQIIKIAVDCAFETALDEQDGSSYREQAIDACVSAAEYLKKIKMGLVKYKEPSFLYLDEDPEESVDVVSPNLDEIINEELKLGSDPQEDSI